MPAGANGDDLLFDAVLHPNRSLSRGEFRFLIAAVAGLFLIGAAVFFSVGAWPVAGFLGLELVLLYGAFRLSYRSGTLTETVRLSREALTVKRISPSGRVQAWDFQPYWLRVELEEPLARSSRVTLASHGRRLTVGAFLSPRERAEFAEALRDALRRCRCLPAPIG